MLPYYFQIPLGAILAIVDPVVIGIVEKPEVISVSKLIKSGLAVIAGKWIVLKPRTQDLHAILLKFQPARIN